MVTTLHSVFHHANHKEIETGKLAQENGQSKEVKKYGKVLVKDHTAADKTDLVPTLQKHQAMAEKLAEGTEKK